MSDKSLASTLTMDSSGFELMCRVCLVKDSSSLLCSLADQDTRELLFQCTSVQVQPGDNYPQQICSKCWSQCRNWSVFKRLARDSDRQLRMENRLMDGGDIEVVKSELLEGDEDIVIVKEEPLEDQEMTTVKEEPLDYLEGYPLWCSEEIEEEEMEMVDHRNEEEEEEEISTEEDSSGTNLMVHSEERSFQRDECGKKQNSESHKLMPSGIKAFQCDKCDIQLSDSSLLLVHKLFFHPEEKPFSCDECGKKFKTKRNFEAHKLIHSGM